jgi:hypothetical protein
LGSSAALIGGDSDGPSFTGGGTLQGGSSAPRGPTASTKVVSYETKSPTAVKPQDVTTEWDRFLGPGPYTNKHPRTGNPTDSLIVSADGMRSIRYGNHEMNSSPTKHHYHEETWIYDAASDTMTVINNLVRIRMK